MTLAPSLFPVPKGWQLLNVEKIRSPEKSSCVSGPFGSKIASKYFVEEGVPVIRGNNLRDDLTRFVPSGFVFVSENQAGEYRPQHVKGGDLVFTCWGTIGQVGLIPDNGPFEQYIISNKQLKLRVDRRIANPVFCFYQIASPAGVGYIRNRGIGGAVPGINLGILKALPVALPDLETQNRIVSVLSAYDDLIENNRRRMVLLEESARLLYREWFVRLRFPGHESTRIVNGVPEGWERVSLQSFINVTHGFAFQGQHFSDQPTSRILTTPGNFRIGGGIKFEKAKFYNEDGPLPSTYALSPMDLILSMTDLSQMCDTLGFPAFVPQVDGRSFLHNQRIGKVVPLGTFFPKHFLYCIFCDDSYRHHVVGAATGTSVKHTSPKRILSYAAAIPTGGNLIESFEEQVGPIFVQINCLIAMNQKLRAARDLLLPKLMSGEIEV